MKNSKPKIFKQGKKPTCDQLKIAFNKVKLKTDTQEFLALANNYGYERKTNQICSICSHTCCVSVAQIARKINSSQQTEQIICRNCSPSNLNETAIVCAIEIALCTKFERNKRHLKIFRDDYSEYFKDLKRDVTYLELDAIEVSNESNQHRKKIIIEVDGVTHYKNKNGLNRDSKRTQLADRIKNDLVPKLFPDHIFIRIQLNESGHINENLANAFEVINKQGIYISPEIWQNSIADMRTINTTYRAKIINNINESGAKFQSKAPAVIQQNTILQLFCKNGSTWSANASVFALGTAGCPCFECGNRRPLLREEVDDIAKRAGVKIMTEKSEYFSDDSVQCSCIKCNSVQAEYIRIRTIRGKSRENDTFSCRYCNINSAIPAIKLYISYQVDDKLTEKDARKKVLTEFGVNAASLWQSFRNDYRDNKLTPACRMLLETEFNGQLVKKKRGNKFSDAELVTCFEKLRRGQNLSENELLQTEESMRKRFRKKAREGMLSEDIKQRLIAIGVNLDTYKAFTSKERLHQLNEFVEQNGRLPTASDADQDCYGLYAWQRDQYHKLKHCKLADQNLVASLTAIRSKIKSVA